MPSPKVALSCFVAGILTIVFVAYADAQPPTAFAESPGRTDTSTLERVLSRARSVTGLQPKSQGDLVLFIPGILGSGLKDGNATIWGEGAPLTVQSLGLPLENPPRATAFILDAYYVDVYGQMRQALRERVVTSEEDIIEWAYDWRHDIGHIADWLDEDMRGALKAKLSKRRVTIIAHSMGGLVAWTWKNKWARQPGRYDFEVTNLIVLGTPLQGSCEMLRLLLSGYRPEQEGALKERIGYKLLFGSLRAAAYTFPSVFQLLPQEQSPANADLQTSCLVGVDAYPQPVSHFNLTVWDKRLLPLLDVSWLSSWFGAKSVWGQLGMGRDKFLDHLNRMLHLGAKFREIDLSEEPFGRAGSKESRITYFYSDEHATTFQISVKNGAVDSERILTQGDGRVPRDSATNMGNRESTPLEEGESHGGLIGGHTFLSWLRDHLADSLKGQAAQDTLHMVWSNDAGRAFLNAGDERLRGLIALSDFGIEPLQAASDSFAKTVIDVNKAVLRRMVGKPLPDNELPQAAYMIGEQLRMQQRPSDATPYYELALSSNLPGELTPYALTAYSDVLLDTKAYDRAVRTLEAGRSLVETRSDVASVAYNNLGRAYECLADVSRAQKAYFVAVAAGSAEARTNIETLGLKRDACR